MVLLRWVRLSEWRWRVIAAVTLLVLLVPASFAAVPDADVDAFIEQFAAEHDFSRARLKRWFAHAKVQPGIIKAMMRPTTALPWYEFRASHVSAARINSGLEYWNRYATLIAQAAEASGVPPEMLVATIGIESFYGRRAGTSNVFNALYTLAFNYPPRAERDRKSTRLNSSHTDISRMPSSA